MFSSQLLREHRILSHGFSTIEGHSFIISKQCEGQKTITEDIRKKVLTGCIVTDIKCEEKSKCILGCNMVWFGESLTFQRNILPPSLEHRPRNQPKQIAS
jgi:hypothetical protein